ncbi:MAG TPA: hypothetical protein ENI23_13710, partial [bacterium]|nr:hypothetical protein [bacterium]
MIHDLWHVAQFIRNNTNPTIDEVKINEDGKRSLRGDGKVKIADAITNVWQVAHRLTREVSQLQVKVKQRNNQINHLKVDLEQKDKKIVVLNAACIYAYDELKHPSLNPENKKLTL